MLQCCDAYAYLSPNLDVILYSFNMSSIAKKSENEELVTFRLKLTDLIKCLLNLKGQDLLEAFNILKTALIPHLLENSSTFEGLFFSNEKADDSPGENSDTTPLTFTTKAQLVKPENVKGEKNESYEENVAITLEESSGMQNDLDYCLPYPVDISKDNNYMSFIKSCDGKEQSEQFDEKLAISSPNEQTNPELILDLCSKGKIWNNSQNHQAEIITTTEPLSTAAPDAPDNVSFMASSGGFVEDKPANLVSVIQPKDISVKDGDEDTERILVTDIFSSNKTPIMASISHFPDEKHLKYCHVELDESSLTLPENDHTTITLFASIENSCDAANPNVREEQEEEASDLHSKEETDQPKSPEDTVILDLVRRKDVMDKSVKNEYVLKQNTDDTIKKKASKQSKGNDQLNKKESSQTYECRTCGLIFNQMYSYKRHISAHKRNQCSYCPNKYSNRRELNSHLKQEHNIKFLQNFGCKFCDRVFHKKVSLYYHLSSHVNSDQKVCQKCGQICKFNEYEAHLEEHAKNDSHRCHICKESFTRSQQYHDHMKHHEKNKCEYCEMSFANKKALFKHSRAVHKKLPKNVSLDKVCKCEKCGALFSRPCLLRGHMKLHEGLFPYACDLCNKNFKHRRSHRKHLLGLAHKHKVLNQNVILTKQGDGDVSLKCEYCSIELSSAAMLKDHCNTVHNKAPIQKCNICDYKTSNIKLFKRHLNVHYTDKFYICEICGNSFKNRDSLRGHFTFQHSDERNFKCTKCEKTFKNKSCLVRHEKIHLKEKPHQCHCGSRYNQLSNLKRHLKTAHGSIGKTKNSSPNKEKSEIDKEIKIPSRSSFETFTDSEVASLPSPLTVPQGLTVLPNLQGQDDTLRDSNDFLMTSGDAVLMADPNNISDPSTSHFAVLDSHLFHLIPSGFQINQDNLHTVSFVGNELHTLSIAPPYSTTQGIEEGFAVSEPNLDPNLSHSSRNLPNSSLPLDHFSTEDNIGPPVLDFSVSSPEKLNARGNNVFSEGREDNKPSGLDLPSGIGEGDLNFVSNSLQDLGYTDGVESQSMPSAGFIVQQSFPTEILHNDIIL